MNGVNMNHAPNKNSILLNRILYGSFVLLGLYFSFSGADAINGISNFGIALIFDPFDQNVAWHQRPRYQRIWLFVHIAVLVSALTCVLLFRLLY